MTFAQSWAQIPLELRQRAQWCFTYPADPEPKRRKAPRTHENRLASVTSPSEWLTFDQAAQYAFEIGGDIGYVLTEDDGYTCIDLDVKDASNEPNKEKWTTQAQFDRFWSICQHFDSYTEKSRGLKGLHIWIKGDIGRGGRRDGVEVYSRERFIICTGEVVLPRSIEERSELLGKLIGEIRAAQDKGEQVELIEYDEEEPDHVIIERAMEAGNGEKFNALCVASACEGDGDHKVHGSYVSLGYRSQSEADLALLSIFTFYSKSNAQCRRLFRMSNLGKRAKSMQDDRYLNLTLTLIRSRQAREEKIEAAAINQSAELIRQMQADKIARGASLLHVPGTPEPHATPAPASAAIAALGPMLAPVKEQGLDWPPGLAGQIAYYIYQSSPRPVREVAIVAALGFLAGVCGKAFCIPQSGLNLYIILIARSAVGKEAMHSGIASLITAAANRQPPVMSFVDFNDFASGPALSKAVAANPSFVNVAGEWGKKLKRLADENGRDTAMQGLRTVMTNLYQKSGPQSIVGGISYSQRDNNIASVSGVAYSMIGESTPRTFYEALTQGMMEDGFLSRFTIIEYDGIRPPLNVNPLREPSKALGDAVAELCTHAHTMLSRHDSIMVGRTEAAAQIMQAFELECDDQINATGDEMWRQMWNRASLKMMRISALLAVAENWINPIIQDYHTDWALSVIRRDIGIMSRRIEEGDVGNGDDSREKKILNVVKEYLEGNISKGYKIDPSLIEAKIVPRKFIMQRVSNIGMFTNHRLGSNGSVDLALKSICDNGYLMEISRDKVAEKHGFYGRCYRVLHIPDHRPKK